MSIIKTGGDFATVMLGLFLGVASFFYKNFVITKVWSYTAVKMAHLPAIGMWQAFALASLFSVVTYDFNNETTELEKPADAIVRPLTSLAVLTFSWGLSYCIFG